MLEKLKTFGQNLLADRPSIIIGLVLALFCIIGLAVDQCIVDNSFTTFGKLLTSGIPRLVVLAPLFASLVHLIMSSLDRAKPLNPSKPELPWYAIFVLLLAVWSVGIFCCWPGNLGWDFTDQLLQTLGQVELSNHHPYLMTAAYGWLYQIGRSFGGGAGGIAFMLVIQVLLCAGSFSWALTWLARMGAPTWLQRSGLLYYAACPQVALYVTVLTKDVPSSAALAFCTAQAVIHLWANAAQKECPKVASWPALTLSFLVCSLMRHNNVYQLLPMMLVMVFMESKQIRAFALSLLLSAAGLLFLWNSVVLPSQHVKAGNAREALCVPLQQVALVCKEHANELTYEEQELVMRYWNMPPEWLAQYFDYHSGDNAKAFFNTSNKMKLGDFFGLWFKLGTRYPGLYLREALANSVGYWYPGVKSYNNKEYILCNVTKYDPQATVSSMDSWIYDFYGQAVELRQVHVANAELRDRFSELIDRCAEAPIVSYLYRPATYVWASLLLGVWAALRRSPAAVLLVSNVMLFLVCCASPLHIAMRYVLPMIFTLPIMLGACVCVPRRR